MNVLVTVFNFKCICAVFDCVDKLCFLNEIFREKSRGLTALKISEENTFPFKIFRQFWSFPDIYIHKKLTKLILKTPVYPNSPLNQIRKAKAIRATMFQKILGTKKIQKSISTTKSYFQIFSKRSRFSRIINFPPQKIDGSEKFPKSLFCKRN